MEVVPVHLRQSQCLRAHLRAEHGCAIAGHILLVALVEVALGFLGATALAWALAIGVAWAVAGMGKLALGIAQVGGRAGHPWRAVLVLIGRRLELIQRRCPSHPLDAVSCEDIWYIVVSGISTLLEKHHSTVVTKCNGNNVIC